MSGETYTLKITLDGIDPAIWRRFSVPADISLDRLHDVIQIVMGWQDCHLHGFEIAGSRYTESPESPRDGVPEEMFCLGELMTEQGTEFTCRYDFGDGWQHQLVLERIQQSPPVMGSHEVPVACLGGEGDCPPEDVGVASGYIAFCEALSDPHHPRYFELKAWYEGFEWYDGAFDRNHLSLPTINRDLLKYLRWSRPRQTLASG